MITIGFSSHRAEIIPFARQIMEQHQIIVLEEPPHPNFADMLNGNLSIADYLMQPVFKKLGCKRRNMEPGNILTFRYALNLPIKQNIANVLAARSLIYIEF